MSHVLALDLLGLDYETGTGTSCHFRGVLTFRAEFGPDNIDAKLDISHYCPVGHHRKSEGSPSCYERLVDLVDSGRGRHRTIV